VLGVSKVVLKTNSPLRLDTVIPVTVEVAVTVVVLVLLLQMLELIFSRNAQVSGVRNAHCGRCASHFKESRAIILSRGDGWQLVIESSGHCSSAVVRIAFWVVKINNR
jgi:hypothetical protein